MAAQIKIDPYCSYRPYQGLHFQWCASEQAALTLPFIFSGNWVADFHSELCVSLDAMAGVQPE